MCVPDGKIYGEPPNQFYIRDMRDYDGPNKQLKLGYVNGLRTKSGTHDTHVRQKLIDLCVKTNSDKLVTTDDIKKYINNKVFVVANCVVDKPKFDSQSKTKLTSAVPADLVVLTKKDLSELTKYAQCVSAALVEMKLKKTDKQIASKNKQDLIKVGKYYKVKIKKGIDAEYAGTNKWEKCSLMLTEGDSACSLARSMTDDYRKFIGVIPLKGKIENVFNKRGAQPSNAELIDVDNVLRGGVKPGTF